jgi:hypothetical protein
MAALFAADLASRRAWVQGTIVVAFFGTVA